MIKEIQYSYLENLKVTNFRNFENFHTIFSKNSNLIIGPNGSGKTNILELISLLSAGKGIRSAKQDEQIKKGCNVWKAKFDLKSYHGKVIIEQQHNLDSGKKFISLNDQKISSNELSNFTNIFWLIPQQNTIFLQATSDRRKFFDRIVYNFDNNHASRIAKYEHYQKERLKLLLMDKWDRKWLEILEQKISDISIEILQKRWEIIEKLQDSINNINSLFPHIILKLNSEIDDIFIENKNNLENLKNIILETLEKNRIHDKSTHKTNYGVHKSDFFCILTSKNSIAKFCSTGEQQSILITILLGVIDVFVKKYYKYPIVILDEIFVHLDESRRESLSKFLISMEMQSIVTSTEHEFCKIYSKNSNIISLI